MDWHIGMMVERNRVGVRYQIITLLLCLSIMAKIFYNTTCERCKKRVTVDKRKDITYCSNCGKLFTFSLNWFRLPVYFVCSLIFSIIIFPKVETTNGIPNYLFAFGIIAALILFPLIKSSRLKEIYKQSLRKNIKTEKLVKSDENEDLIAEIKNGFGYKLGDEFNTKLSLLKITDVQEYTPEYFTVTKKNGEEIELLIQADKEFDVENEIAVELKSFFTKPFQFHHLVKPKEKSPYFNQYFLSDTPLSNLIYEIFAYTYKKNDDPHLMYAQTEPGRKSLRESKELVLYEIGKSDLFEKYKGIEEMLGYLYGKYTLTEDDLKISSVWKRHFTQIELTYKPIFDEYFILQGHLIKISYTDSSVKKIFEIEKKEVEEENRQNKIKRKGDKLERLENFDIKGL